MNCSYYESKFKIKKYFFFVCVGGGGGGEAGGVGDKSKLIIFTKNLDKKNCFSGWGEGGNRV